MSASAAGQKASSKGETPLFAPQKRQIRHHVEYLGSVAAGKPVLNTILRQVEVLTCSVFRTIHSCKTAWLGMGGLCRRCCLNSCGVR